MKESSLANIRIVLGVTGSIAVYKSADLCRQLIKAGAQVQVIMTRAATKFVAPLTFETLSGRPVYHKMFDRQRAWEMEHISLARWGQVLAIAPATANVIAKMAAGLADDSLTTTVLAFSGPIVVVPAMNTVMWEHPQTQENVGRLRDRGVRILKPGAGELACGETGAGRMEKIDLIVKSIEKALAESRSRGPLAGKRILITAGPTVEPIDPIRFLSNAASGRMGFALAAEAERRGGEVTLIAGPTSLDPPHHMGELVRVRTASELRDAVMERFAEQDICLFTAAVADFTPTAPASEKIKKLDGEETLTLELVRAPDASAEAVAARRRRRADDQVIVGFAAETGGDLAARARAKMEAKGYDMIVANEVSPENPALGAAENAVTLIARSGENLALPRVPKEDLAAPIWDFIVDHLEKG